MRMQQDEAAVSEVVGALMLVVVVSSAAFGFGLFLHQQASEAEAQKAIEQAKALEKVSIARVAPDDSVLPDDAWDRLDITLLSEHLHNTTVTQLLVNGMAVRQAELEPFDGSRVVTFDPADPNFTPFVLSAREQVVLRLTGVENGTSFFAPATPILKSDALQITLLTALGNRIERAFVPPSAIIVLDQQGTGAGSYILDGSSSETTNADGFLVRYAWHVVEAYHGNTTDGPLDVVGRRAQATIMCDTGECTGSQLYTITLVVTDNLGLSGEATLNVTL